MPKFFKRAKGLRNAKGFHLVETLCASLVVSLAGAGMMKILSTMYNVNAASQNQVMASTIAQEIVDNARNQSFPALSSQTSSGWVSLLTNNTGLGTAPGAYQRPLLLDKTKFKYIGDGASTDSNKQKLFRGSVRQKIESVDADTLSVTVEVTFPNARGKNAKFTSKSMISRYGLHD